MTRKQLQALISAGVFSTSLLSGTAYADNMPAASGTPKPKKAMHKKMASKAHACAGKNDCKGKGGCKTSDQGCAGKNSCKGKGGCKTSAAGIPSSMDIQKN